MAKSSSKPSSFQSTSHATTEPLNDEFYNGTSTFLFPNGDEYEGEFSAHYSGVIWKEGRGTYKTKDGQIYVGEWQDDKLLENQDLEIIYPSGVSYNGSIVNNKYIGPGTYHLENKMVLLCKFNNNKPIGDFILMDINGRPWHELRGQDKDRTCSGCNPSDIYNRMGTAKDVNALLFQEHVFYANLGKDQGKGVLKHKPEEETTEKISLNAKSEEHSDDKELEKLIFAKSTKTIFDLNFEESDWYKNYNDFLATYQSVMKKIGDKGLACLNTNELKWYNDYLEFKKKYKQIMASKKLPEKILSDCKLFEIFHSNMYRKKCPAVSTFYARKNNAT